LENEEGSFGNVHVVGKLVNLKPEGEVLVIGDLHGDLSSLEKLFAKSGFAKKLETEKNASVVFLGDYGDRGPRSPEVYYSVLSLKLAYPQQVILLRGNHEGPNDLLASPHDLPVHLQRKFKEKWVPIYKSLTNLFGYLHNAVYVKARYLMVHGGLPSKVRSLQDIAEADKLHPKNSFLEELLWNDPDDQVQGIYQSARGLGNTFGKTVTHDVLQKLGAKILIRGHEPAGEGYRISHDGSILTLFSRKGPPYYNRHGAFLQLPLAEKFETADQLLPYVHKF
jgi:diadenosine tetraphosphatase ApaH/serine/threonine PP2A family protein phosphatase